MNVSKNDNLAIYTVLLAVFNTVIYKYTSNNFILAIPPYFKVDNYETVDNFLLMKSGIEDTMKFKNLLIKTKQSLIETYKNQVYPIDGIIKEKNIDSMIEVNFIMSDLHNHKNIEFIMENTKRKINCLIRKYDDTLEVKIIYNENYFSNNMICEFSKVYLNVLN